MALNDPPIQDQTLLDNFFSRTWSDWFALVARSISFIRTDGSLEMPTLADADAENNSLYYSSTQSKLVFKDSGGVVNDLY